MCACWLVKLRECSHAGVGMYSCVYRNVLCRCACKVCVCVGVGACVTVWEYGVCECVYWIERRVRPHMCVHVCVCICGCEYKLRKPRQVGSLTHTQSASNVSLLSLAITPALLTQLSSCRRVAKPPVHRSCNTAQASQLLMHPQIT